MFRDTPDEDAEAHETFGRILMTIAPRIGHLQREALSKLDPPLGLTQYSVLSRLGRGVNSMSALRARSRVTFSTLSEATSALVRQGLVDRVRSDQDRRSVNLSLTDEGRRVLELADVALAAIQERLVEGFPAPSQQDLETFWHPLSFRVRELLSEQADEEERDQVT